MGKDIHDPSQSKHILFVSNSTWNIYNFRLNLVKHLIKQGHKVTIAAPADKYLPYLQKIPSLEVQELKKLNRASMNPLINLLLFRELYHIYRNVQPDLVLQYTIKPNLIGSLVARTLSIPSISVITGLGYTFLDGHWLRTLIKWLYRYSLKKCNKVVFENPDDKRLFLDLNIVEPHQATVVNGCGINVEKFKPQKKTRQDGQFIFTFIGRLLHDKGIREFVQAAQQLKPTYPKLSFWVVGEPDNDNPSSVKPKEIARWAEDGKISYLGPTDQVQDFIADSDCIVLPSYREGLPKILLEAMAMGKPIITTDVPGCRELVKDEINGYLVEVKNANSLTAAIYSLMNTSQKKLEAMGLASVQIVLNRFQDFFVIHDFDKIFGESLHIKDSAHTNTSRPYSPA